MFENYTDEDIKLWLTKNKVLFVTNSMMLPGSVYVASLKTYLDKIPIHNLYMIPGIVNGTPYYGVQAFMLMLNNCFMNQHPVSKFDYIIYIDEDCFITDFRGMLEEFADFIKDDEYCLAGPQDGGVICHRNHRHNLINTFISFWNVKLMKESGTLNEFADICKKFSNQKTGYSEFVKVMESSEELKSVLERMNSEADQMLDISDEFRTNVFGKKKESPYAETVRNDKSNEVEPNQKPYTCEDPYGRKHLGNFEPYYLLEEALIVFTKRPIKYLFAADYYSAARTDEDTDNSGLTTQVIHFRRNGKKVELDTFAIHTWFARAYTKWPVMPVQKVHTDRINKVIFENCQL